MQVLEHDPLNPLSFLHFQDLPSTSPWNILTLTQSSTLPGATLKTHFQQRETAIHSCKASLMIFPAVGYFNRRQLISVAFRY